MVCVCEVMKVRRGWEGICCRVQLGSSAGIWGVGAVSCVQCSRMHVDPLCVEGGECMDWVVVFFVGKLCPRYH